MRACGRAGGHAGMRAGHAGAAVWLHSRHARALLTRAPTRVDT